jgi:hypothetical protein
MVKEFPMARKYEQTVIEDHVDQAEPGVHAEPGTHAEPGVHRHVQRTVVDESATARRTAYQIASIVRVLFGVLIGAIGLRFFLMLIGANPENFFAETVYLLTDIFVWPFFGIVGTPSFNGFVLDFPAMIAMIVYALIAWVVVRLVWLLFYRP